MFLLLVSTFVSLLLTHQLGSSNEGAYAREKNRYFVHPPQSFGTASSLLLRCEIVFFFFRLLWIFLNINMSSSSSSLYTLHAYPTSAHFLPLKPARHLKSPSSYKAMQVPPFSQGFSEQGLFKEKKNRKKVKISMRCPLFTVLLVVVSRFHSNYDEPCEEKRCVQIYF